MFIYFWLHINARLADHAAFQSTLNSVKSTTVGLSYRIAARDDHGNGIPIPIGNPMGMGIDDTIGNGNGKEWESPCMGMGVNLIPM